LKIALGGNTILVRDIAAAILLYKTSQRWLHGAKLFVLFIFLGSAKLFM